MESSPENFVPRIVIVDDVWKGREGQMVLESLNHQPLRVGPLSLNELTLTFLLGEKVRVDARHTEQGEYQRLQSEIKRFLKLVPCFVPLNI